MKKGWKIVLIIAVAAAIAGGAYYAYGLMAGSKATYVFKTEKIKDYFLGFVCLFWQRLQGFHVGLHESMET